MTQHTFTPGTVLPNGHIAGAIVKGLQRTFPNGVLWVPEENIAAAQSNGWRLIDDKPTNGLLRVERNGAKRRY